MGVTSLLLLVDSPRPLSDPIAVNANVNNVFKFSFPCKTIKYKAAGEKYYSISFSVLSKYFLETGWRLFNTKSAVSSSRSRENVENYIQMLRSLNGCCVVSPLDCLRPAAAQVSSAVPFSPLLTTTSLTLIWAPRQRYIKIDDMSQLCKMFTLRYLK